MHTIRLLLKTTESENAVIERRFHAISHIHNVLVKQARKLLKKLFVREDYAAYRTEYSRLLAISKERKFTMEEKYMKNFLSKEMAGIRKSLGLTEYGLQAYIKICAKQYRKLLSSQQVQKEATRVYRGVEKILFSNGKELHFRKFRNVTTICGKTNTNGVKFDRDSMCIHWMGLDLPCKLPKHPEYITEALKDSISYCEIERKMFPNGWHYYVIVYLRGDAPKKLSGKAAKPNRKNITGIDIGTSTIATVSENQVTLQELAPGCREYNKQINRLLQRMDISRRMLNPEKYHPDGTINRSNRSRWKYSNTYQKNQRKLQTLYRKKAAYIKQSHEEMIAELLLHSVDFLVERMSFKGLQKRSKKTEYSDKVSEIVQKDGTKKQIHKYKRKKRFGRSMNNRAPSRFLTILEQKVSLYGGSLNKVNTVKFRASQYSHDTDSYEKYTLKDRFKIIGTCEVQRDLYSAFLIRNSDSTLEKPDRKKCLREFPKFIAMQTQLIQTMKEEHQSMKECFGF